jgi:hypothetical protein
MSISAAKVAACVLLASAVVVSAKGPTVKLTVSGGHLQSPIEVTSQPALVHVWSDGFIGAPAAQPRAELLRYQVAFHVLPKGRREAQVLYVVTYAHDPASGDSFVYLPGRGEEHYALNASTILREGQDGGWHRAVPAWAEALNLRLRQ